MAITEQQIAFDVKNPLSATQKASITNLVNKGTAFSETDAKNYAFATGQLGKEANFIGKTGAQIITPTPIQNSVSANDISNPKTDIPTASGTPVDTTPQAVSGFSTAQDQLTKMIQKNIDDAAKAEATQQAKKTDVQQQIIDTLGTLGQKGERQIQVEEQFGRSKNIEQLQALNTQAAQLTAEFNKAIEGLSAGTGLSTTIAGKQGQLRRQAAVELGAITSIAQAVQGNIALAESTAKRTVDLEFEDEENKLKTLGFQLDFIKEDLTDAQTKKADALKADITRRENEIAEQKEERNAIFALSVKAVENGAPQEIAQKMQLAKTKEEALEIVRKYLPETPKPIKIGVDANGEDIMGYYDTFTQSFKSINAKGSVDTVGDNDIDVPSYIKDAIDVVLGSGKFTKEQQKSFINAVQNGEDPYTVIKNQAKNLMGQTEATNLSKFEVAKSTMVDLQTLLSEYYAKGGNTDIFKGSINEVANKLGQVGEDGLTEIRTNITAALQIYRNAVSGTAYSEQEGQDIASIFPGINKTQGLNDAILRGRLKAFDSVIDGTYRTALGGVYDTLKEMGEENNLDTSNLTPILQSFNSVEALLRQHDEYKKVATLVSNKYPTASEQQLIGFIQAYSPGFNQPLSMGSKGSIKVASNIVSSFQAGQKGGQCGDFTHKIVDIPPMGNYFSEKQKSVNKNGIPKAQWTPQIGDVVITDGSDVSRTGQALTYGHAAVVVGIKPNGELVLLESNAKGNEKVTKGRTIAYNDPSIYGALRGQIKSKYLT